MICLLLTWWRLVLSLDAPSFRAQRPPTILWGAGEYRTSDRVSFQQHQSTKKQELIHTLLCGEKQASKGFYSLVREAKCWDVVDISAQMSEDMSLLHPCALNCSDLIQLPGRVKPKLSTTLPQLCSFWARAGLCLARLESKRWIGVSPQLSFAISRATDRCVPKKRDPQSFHHHRDSFCIISCGCLTEMSRIAWP